MAKGDKKNFEKRVLEEMAVDYADALEKNFELAKQFIRITSEGKIDVIVKDKLPGKECILLYLIGKLYAKQVDLASVEYVGNKELKQELGIPNGSLYPWLKALRDENKIRAVKRGYHTIPINLVERALKKIEKKLERK